MNKKDECEIVKDLAIPYIEEVANQGSKKFVQEHLQICNDCKKYYNNIKSEIVTENTKENNKDTIVINQFKKINKHINILKVTLVLILIIIIITSLILFIRHQKVYNIISKAYNKIEYIRDLDNYRLTVKTIQKNNDTNSNWEYTQNYYYKDGKYKIESDDSIFFYKDDSYEKTSVYHDLNTIEYYKQDFIEITKGKVFDIFSEILNYKELVNGIYSLALSVREDNYNGINCYVIRFGNDNSYRDTWINKNNFITIRVVNKIDTNSYREEIYTFYENIVNNNDVDITVLNSDKYKNYTIKNITNNATEKTKLYYKIYNK